MNDIEGFFQIFGLKIQRINAYTQRSSSFIFGSNVYKLFLFDKKLIEQ